MVNRYILQIMFHIIKQPQEVFGLVGKLYLSVEAGIAMFIKYMNCQFKLPVLGTCFAVRADLV